MKESPEQFGPEYEKIDSNSIPEFNEPEDISIETYQGDKPAISTDGTPLKTPGLNMCSPLLIRRGKVSVLFHVENSGLTDRQRTSLSSLPKGEYQGKAIENERSNISDDTLHMFEHEAGIKISMDRQNIQSGGFPYDFLYRPTENKIYIKIKGPNVKVLKMDGFF